MTSKSLTIERLAEKTGVSPRTIANALASKTLNRKTAQLIAGRGLGVSIEYLSATGAREQAGQPARLSSHLADDLSKCTSISAILNILHKRLSAHSLRRLRYYRYIDAALSGNADATTADSKLVSIDSVGHDAEVAGKIRLGRIWRARHVRRFGDDEAFRAVDSGVPILFTVVPATVDGVSLNKRDGITEIEIDEDPCGEHLTDRANDKQIRWMDFPLRSGNRVIGKFSADLTDNAAPREVVKFQDIANLAAGFIDSAQWHEHHSIETADRRYLDIRIELQRCDSLEKLYDYCTKGILPHFQARYASFFTILTDSFSQEQLVLRKTAYAQSQLRENAFTYNLSSHEDRSLTAWCARNKRSMRLHDLGAKDKTILKRQLDLYGCDADWPRADTNTLKDSDLHTSYLAVPLVFDNELIGLIRMTERAISREGGFFTLQDERLLEHVARSLIAPRLHAIRKNLLLQRTTELLDRVARRGRPNGEESLKQIVMDLFPEQPNNRRLFLINGIIADTGRANVLSHSGKLPFDTSKLTVGKPQKHKRLKTEDLEFELAESLTGRAWLTADPLFIADTAFAVKHKALNQIATDAKCVLACKTMFPTRGSPGLVVVIESDKFDLSPELDAILLQHVTRLMSIYGNDSPTKPTSFHI